MCPESNAWYMIYTIGEPNHDALSLYIKDVQAKLSGESNDTELSVHQCTSSLPANLQSADVDEIYNVWGDYNPIHTPATVMSVFRGDDIEQLEHNELPVLGNKSSLGSTFKKISRSAIHRLHGHQGYDPECDVCRGLRRTTRRAYNKRDDFKSMLPGAVFAMDAANHNVPAECGSLLYTIARDV